MHKHSPKKRKKMLRRQGTIIFVLIVAVVACLLAILGLVIADHFSGKTDVSNTSLSSATSGSENTTAKITSETTPTSTSTSTSTETSESSGVTSEPPEVTETTIDNGTTPTLPQNITGPDLTGYVVVLDPGHQQTPNRDQEPLSPTMSGSKDKVSSGTQGVKTGRPEYEVNLEIGLLLRAYLEELGCTVYMTRTENDVDISNIERAEFALSYSPDAYIRLHCDGSSDSSRKGIGVFVANTGKHEGSLVGWADLLGQALSDATGTNYRGCNASSRYSGLNWATDIPSFLLEMGYMSNSAEDVLLSDPDYQIKICKGIADFVSQMPINPDREQA
jgi:N-acetylmuramoyl-L-alanine amidase